MSYPYCGRCFTCGSCKPMAILEKYMKLKQLECDVSDFTTRGADVDDKAKSFLFMEEAEIYRQCCRRMMISVLNKEIDITRDPVKFEKSSEKDINKDTDKEIEKIEDKFEVEGPKEF